MKKLFAVALPAAIAIAAVLFAANVLQSRSETAEARAERARLKRDFAERAALARGLPADARAEWRDESAALLRWYLDELAAIRNRHPGETPRPTALEAAAAERKGKPLGDKEKATFAEFQRYADERLALVREGRYAATQSAADGGLRLDLLRVEPGPSPEGGGPGLRIDFALWGAPNFVERDRSGDRTTTRHVVPVVLKRIAFRFLDERGKVYGEMSGSGEPYLKLADPERWSDDFPPSILFGTWWVEPFPRETQTAELTVEAGARGAAGAERGTAFQFKLPVPDAWKLPPGATFQAEVREGPASP